MNVTSEHITVEQILGISSLSSPQSSSPSHLQRIGIQIWSILFAFFRILYRQKMIKLELYIWKFLTIFTEFYIKVNKHYCRIGICSRGRICPRGIWLYNYIHLMYRGSHDCHRIGTWSQRSDLTYNETASSSTRGALML